MLKRDEVFVILLATLIISFAASLTKSLEAFSYALISVLAIVFLNVFAKKITAYYLDSQIEIKLWQIERYGFQPKRHFKRPFPAGLFLPIIITVITFGYIRWMASLIFDVKPQVYRTAKRHGIYAFSEVTESHMGIIAASGIFMNLVLAVAGYLIGWDEFSRLNIYYAFFNMLPFSDLDGNKIFFGSLIMWSFLAAVVLIGLAYAFFVI